MRRVLRERRWTILFVTVVFAGVGIFFDARSPTTWGPFAQVAIGPLTGDTPFLGIRTLKAEVSPEENASRIATFITDPAVLSDARRRLGNAAPAGYSLDGRTQPGPAGVPGRVGVQVLDQDRERGVLAANAVAESLAAYVNRREIARLDEVIATLRRGRRSIRTVRVADQRALFRRRLLTYFDRREVDAQLATLETVRRVAEPAKVAARATPPEHPIFKPGHRAWPAIYMGLSLGLLMAFVLDGVSRRPRDLERLTAAAGLPLVARVPRLGRRRRRAVHLAYEHLRAAAEGLGREGPAKIVLVTSPDPGAGKSTVALGIAQAAAAAGRSGCIVECDLHRPSLGPRLALAGPGLGDRLAGRARPEDVILEAPSADAGRALHVVLAGSPPRRPAEALASRRFRDLLDSLAASHELVVIDAPPILAASEALALVPLVDAVLLCGRVGRTPVDELEAARAALDRLAPVPAALVLTGVPENAQVLAPQRGRSYRPSPRVV